MPLINIDDLPVTMNVAPGWDGRFLHSENLTVAKWCVTAGTKLAPHSHPNEQLTILLSGEFEFTIDGICARAKPGHIAIVPSNVDHSGLAVTDCQLMDIFYPLRKEYRVNN